MKVDLKKEVLLLMLKGKQERRCMYGNEWKKKLQPSTA